MTYLLIGCRWLIALVFVASAVSKLRSRRSWAEFQAATAHLAPAWLLRAAATGSGRAPTGRLLVSVGVVAAEASIPVLLAVRATAVVGFAVAAVLLTGFAVALWRVAGSAQPVACACFATSTAPVGAAHVVRNLILLAVAVVGLAVPAHGSPEPAGILLSVAVAALGATLTTFLDDVVELFR